MSDLTLDQIYDLAMQLDPDARRQLVERLASAPSPLAGAEILDALNRHADELRAMGVERIGVFGSHVRGKGRTDSDIDILVSLAEHTFDAYMDVKLFLEDLFGREVDLVLADSLKPALRPHILEDVQYAPDV
jgi:predicted nucleotidyltransferase